MDVNIFDYPLELATYSFLALSIVSLWISKNPKIWGSLFCISIILGLISNRLEWLSLISIILIGASYWLVFKKLEGIPKIMIGIFTILLSLLLAVHKVPGFNNWKIITDLTLSTNSIPYTMYLNFDKTLMGVFILAFYPNLMLFKQTEDWKLMFKQTFPILWTLAPLFLVGYLINFIQFDFKITSILPIWAIRNLLFVAVVEEVFFRGFLQRNLTNVLTNYQWGKYVSVFAISAFFGVAHIGGGAYYVLLTFLGGLIYGYSYEKTRRIEAAILLHFILNLIHIVFFTYPALNMQS